MSGLHNLDSDDTAASAKCTLDPLLQKIKAVATGCMHVNHLRKHTIIWCKQKINHLNDVESDQVQTVQECSFNKC